MVVVAIIALASSFVVMAIRSSGERELDATAARVVAALEQGRTLSRATGVAVSAVLLSPSANQPMPSLQFFPASRDLPALELPARLTWQSLTGKQSSPATGGAAPESLVIPLGPEPLVAAHSSQLNLERDSVRIETDGLRPFSIQKASLQ